MQFVDTSIITRKTKGSRIVDRHSMIIGSSYNNTVCLGERSRSITCLAQYPRVKCVIVGDGGVGKTSMLLRYVHGQMMDEYAPTHYDNFNVTLALGDPWNRYLMTLVDTAGQETYDRIRTLTYANADVFILCFSEDSINSYTNIRARWLPELKCYQPKTPIILVATQTDLRNNPNGSSDSGTSCNGSSMEQSVVSWKKGKRLAAKIGAKYYAACSALKGEGLNHIFNKALNLAVQPRKSPTFWRRVKQTFSHGT